MAATKHHIVKTLVECGATHAFTLPGLGITWMLDDFYAAREKLRLVLTRSEQHASIMAQAYGKVLGKPGVFMGMGPFATTTGAFGVLEAYFAGSPMVVLTDTSCYDGFAMRGVYQTMTGDYGAADAATVFRTMTKFCAYATEVDEAVYGIQMAFKHATLPRYGPAAVVLKTSIIRREFETNKRITLYPSAGHLVHTPARPDFQAVKHLAESVKQAERPLFVVGQGVQNDRARSLLANVASRAGIAVATSYNGKGVIDETLPISVGMLGTWGCKAANAALRQADLVVAMGASLGPDYMRFCESDFLNPRTQRVMQVDVDARNSGWVYPVEHSITGDAADVLDMLAALDLGEEKRPKREAWIAENNQKHGYGVIDTYKTASGTLHNTEIVRALNKHLTSEHLLTLDAGSNRIWVTGTLCLRTPGQLLAPGGIGGMGWSIPAAVGAKIAKPEKRVIALTGDGGAGMSVAALSTAFAENAPITVVVANNAGLGMVRDNMRGPHYGVDYSHTDFAMIARAMGCRGLSVTRTQDLLPALRESEAGDGPCLIDVAIDPEASHHPASDY
ncbi:MAG: thiamine pyrophosphate-binding protein [Betaproteobacteria bacterium]|jgi:acetolactate synthase-1/2/3 large subunit|nr:thiamine pyrophosphate-binding protein [Betaproteobacteria bacterium]